MCENVRLYTFLFLYMFMYVYLCISAWLTPDSRGSTIREQWSPQSKANSLEDDCLLFFWHRKLDTVSVSLLPISFLAQTCPIVFFNSNCSDCRNICPQAHGPPFCFHLKKKSPERHWRHHHHHHHRHQVHISCEIAGYWQAPDSVHLFRPRFRSPAFLLHLLIT